jgi:hypothetical protein
MIHPDAHEKLLETAVGKCRCFAMDGDGYVVFCRTPWTQAFCQHPLSSVDAIERIFSTQSRSWDGKTDHPAYSRHR